MVQETVEEVSLLEMNLHVRVIAPTDRRQLLCRPEVYLVFNFRWQEFHTLVAVSLAVFLRLIVSLVSFSVAYLQPGRPPSRHVDLVQ
jgi:hypothetical protein